LSRIELKDYLFNSTNLYVFDVNITNEVKMKITFLFLSIFFLIFSSPLSADEGMFPITEIDRIDLPSKGLNISVNKIYNPDDISLMQAIIRLSGCTASFVSPDGLIITNHHCAFGAVQRASTTENDYLTNGFLAADRSQEIPAEGYTASIMESYRDVSSEVLSVITENMDLIERTKAISKKKKELLLQAEKDYPGKRAEISEMFIGKSYLLFIYTRLRDIRLVYVPPLAIGEFGGENDNWIWPRHTGDFSFVRAYVAPDGSPAEYSDENIPYQPKIHFQVAPEGVNEEDFIFIMGYPGSTYRHRTSYYIEYEEKARLPYLASEYEKAIFIMEEFSQKNPKAALKLASPIKSLSNRMKNYRGKLTGMRRINLVEHRRQEENKLEKFISNDESQKEILSDVLNSIEKVYQEKSLYAHQELLIENILRLCTPLKNAKIVYEASENKSKPDIERETAYMDRNFSRTEKQLFIGLKSYYPPSEKVILTGLLKQAMELPAEQKIVGLGKIEQHENIDVFIENFYKSTELADEKFLKDLLSLSSDDIKILDDPAIKLFLLLDPQLKENKERSREQSGALNKLHPKLIEFKKEFYKSDFIPDANSTFRLTYGYIRGYYPKDGMYCSPITTFSGVLEKTTGKAPFITPPDLIDIYQQKKFGQFFNKKLNDVPVAILYNTDTTGGNSGSPVLNAKGQLVGVNFDRAWEATINDYAWNEAYSRSIAVDIRYVLWVTQEFAGADYLLEEMNIPLE
jgi:hypothetical protein